MEINPLIFLEMEKSFQRVVARDMLFPSSDVFREYVLASLCIKDSRRCMIDGVEEKMRYSLPTLALRLFTTIRRRHKERVSGGPKKH